MNTTKYILVCLGMLIVFPLTTLFAQDTIIQLNNTKIIAKIIEVNPKVIKYKNATNPEGPVYTIDKRDVSVINYSNGTSDIFSLKPVKIIDPAVKPHGKYTDFGQNFFYLRPTDLFFGFISGGYEYTLKSGSFSIKMPLSFGLISMGLADSVYDYEYWNGEFDRSNSYYNPYKTFSVGLDFNYYPTGQGMVRFFFGPALEYGKYHYQVFSQIQTPPYTQFIEKRLGSYSSFMMNGGVLFQPTKHFNLSMNIGTGMYMTRRQVYPNGSSGFGYLDPSYSIAIEGGLNVGYRF